LIVVDTSALMAVVLGEPKAEACIVALEKEPALAISAGTVAEALIVAEHRNVRPELESLLDGLGFEVVPVSTAMARRVADAYARWGKGMHRAALNFGDCFAYALAKERGCRLLYVGADFAHTDVERVV